MIQTEKMAILMATYNGKRFLPQQIESILRQSRGGWKLFIHDDGSNDGTREIVRQYAQQYPDRIEIVDGPPSGGVKNNFFYLMKQVRAPYFLFCDQDDVWQPDKIEKLYTRMTETERAQGQERPVLVFSDLTVTDEKLQILAPRLSLYQKLDPKRVELKDLLLQNVVTGCAAMINQSCAEKAGALFDPEAAIMHDWWCALVAACFGTVAFLDEPLVLYRQHGRNTVGAKRVGSLQYVTGILEDGKGVLRSLALTRMQAAAFARVYGLGEESLPARYGRLGELGKLPRLLFYRANGMSKSGWLRNLGLLLWG